MLSSLGFALAAKFLVWVLALLGFMRIFARESGTVDPATRQWLGAVLLGALAGSKLVFALTYPSIGAVESDPNDLLFWLAGDSIAGAVLGGRIGIWLAARDRGRLLADRLVPAAAVAIMLLEFGGFYWALRDHTYGIATSMPWAVDFGDGIGRHPVMLYEAAYLMFALWADRRLAGAGLAAGSRATHFVLGYCSMRVLAGFLKPPFQAMLLTELIRPQARVYGGVMTGEQWVCVLVVACLLPAWFNSLARMMQSRRRRG